MCRDVFGISEANIGVAVGSVQGILSFCQFLSGFYLGHISDLLGRRPLLLGGIAVSCVCTLLFGFAPTLLVALILRGTIGLLTSTAATAKAYLSDITVDSSESARASIFAYFGVAQASSFAIVNGLSAFLSAFRPWSFAPMAVPMIVASIPILLSFLAAIFWLPESLSKKAKTESGNNTIGIEAVAAGESGQCLIVNGDHHDDEDTERSRDVSPTADRTLVDEDSAAEKNDTDDDGKKTSYCESKFMMGLKAIWSDGLLTKLIGLLCSNTFCNGGTIVAFTLILSTPIAQGGVGMKTSQLGYVFTFWGGFGTVFQFFFFSKLQRSFGTLTLYRYFGALACCIGNIFMVFAPIPLQYGQSTEHFAASYGIIFAALVISSIGLMVSSRSNLNNNQCLTTCPIVLAIVIRLELSYI